MTGRNMFILPTEVVSLPSLLLLKTACGRRVPGLTLRKSSLVRQLFLMGPSLLGVLRPPVPLLVVRPPPGALCEIPPDDPAVV